MVVKTGVSLPEPLYQRLRETAESMGYASVSRAIRDAIELFVVYNSWWTARAKLTGVILVLVDGEAVEHVFENARQHYGCVSRLEMRMINNYVLFYVFVEGGVEEVKSLYTSLSKTRGVRVLQHAFITLPH
ncbi:MAG: hypothetical protein DSY37_03525 [Hyperthermus sp.]|nr:MAG: hypothetical protein DSY37_03525 [Hyperthermus sp.]